MMTIYLSRSFPRSNSSFFLSRGSRFKSEVLRLDLDENRVFVVDAGLGTPRICVQDEILRVPINGATRFENEVGFLDRVAGKSRNKIRRHILERFFIKLVVAKLPIKRKERTTWRLRSLLGSYGVMAGEPPLLNPRTFRHILVFMKLREMRRTNTKVKGFFLKRLRRRKGSKRSYLVGIAGFRLFHKIRRLNKKKEGAFYSYKGEIEVLP
uniref:Ribosomal protein S1 n=1 Tax=Geranium maderense TaxID=28964 RepID=A0A0F6QQC8_9ROSI|nr:ribosomal protein S1 [Geranium maderense]AKE32269.1 ribosomal protein S1 [Geranium maderense]AKJ25834.1 ribosomal protein S1 [Geranium maderense]